MNLLLVPEFEIIFYNSFHRPPQPKPVKREESSSFKEIASYSYEEIETPPPDFKIKRESLPGGSNGKFKRKKTDQEYNEITFEQLVEEKAEIFKKTCNNYLKSHFPDCYSPVEEVAVEVGSDFQLQSASVSFLANFKMWILKITHQFVIAGRVPIL